MAQWRTVLLMVGSIGLHLAAFAANPSHMELSRIRAGLAIEYARMGRCQHALEAANEAVKADPSYAAGWLARALVNTLLNRRGDADADYRTALKLAPDYPEANNNYGLFLCDHGQPGAAVKYFRQALANPLYASAETAWVNMGRCCLLSGDKENARDYFLSALRVSPAFTPALKALASLYLELGEARASTFYFNSLSRHLDSLPFGPAELLLGIRIARLARDLAREKELAARLKSRYPDSVEAQQLLSGTLG